MGIKVCGKCKNEKLLIHFYKSKTKKDRYRNTCKLCEKELTQKYRNNNKEKILEINRKYYINNSEHCKNRDKKYRTRNKNKIAKRKHDRYTTDLDFKLREILRSRLSSAIKRNQKAGSAINDLGCSIEEFKLHLERQFEPWMNWDNYGKFDLNRLTWNIDHINALANFDLTNKEEFLKACHYSNLRPLLALDNIKKGKKN